MKLQTEEGTTSVSVENALLLITQHGKPATLDFKADKTKCDYSVTATWPDGKQHTFTGFAWGYSGTGPSGLAHFLAGCGANVESFQIPMDVYGKTDCTLTL